MKSIASAFAFCFLFLSVGVAQVSPVPSLQPTPLEAFAHQPATHVAWSKQVGSLDSSEAHALALLLIVSSHAATTNTSRCGLGVIFQQPARAPVASCLTGLDRIYLI